MRAHSKIGISQIKKVKRMLLNLFLLDRIGKTVIHITCCYLEVEICSVNSVDINHNVALSIFLSLI